MEQSLSYFRLRRLVFPLKHRLFPFPMVHFFGLLLVTGATCLGWIPLAPSGLSSTANMAKHLARGQAIESLFRLISDQSVEPVVDTVTGVFYTQPIASLEKLLASRSDSTNSERIARWVIMALVPVGVVGGTLYYLGRRPDSQGELPPALNQLSDQEAEAKRHHGHTQSHDYQAPTQAPTEATSVAIRSNSDRSNLEAAPQSMEAVPQSNGAAVAQTTRISKIDIVEALITDLHHPEGDQRRKTIWELGQRGDSRAIQPLVDLLVDADSQQRSLILAAIAEISTRTLKPMHRALLISLQDESADVRKNAIRDITRIYDQMSQVSQLLQYAASDTDADVQETAHWALGQLNRFRTSPPEQLKPTDELSLNRDPRLGDSQRS